MPDGVVHAHMTHHLQIHVKDPCDAEILARRVVKSLTSSWSAAERSFLWLTKIKTSGKEMKLTHEPSWIYHQVNLGIHHVENEYPSCMQDALWQRGNWLWWKCNFWCYCCAQWSEGGRRLGYDRKVCWKWNWLLGFTEYLLEIEQHIGPVAELVKALHQIQITKNKDENRLTRNFELTTWNEPLSTLPAWLPPPNKPSTSTKR